MSIKRILIPLPGSAWKKTEIDLGLLVGKALGARVEAVFIHQPHPPAPGGSASQMARAARTMALTTSWYANSHVNAAREAREHFTQSCATIDVPLLSDSNATGSGARALWQESDGPYVAITVQKAPGYDLVVAASGNVMDALKDIAERAILKTGRPVILAPANAPTSITGATMIAWDESPECWHAVSAAIPLLQLGTGVKIVSVDRSVESRKKSQDKLLAYLECHGIAATAEVVTPDINSIGSTLLTIAAQQEVSLLVMGAYSHGRIREKLFGGATHHVLGNASSRPVLLAH